MQLEKARSLAMIAGDMGLNYIVHDHSLTSMVDQSLSITIYIPNDMEVPS